MRILVVDSDRDIREMVVDLLLEQGFEIRQAETADQAVRALQTDAFDALLCHLPALQAKDGCLRRLAREVHPKPLVIAMSAAGRVAASHEADANLAKPFTRSELVGALRPR